MTLRRVFLVALFEELLLGILVDGHPGVGVGGGLVLGQGGLQRLSGWDEDCWGGKRSGYSSFITCFV